MSNKPVQYFLLIAILAATSNLLGAYYYPVYTYPVYTPIYTTPVVYNDPGASAAGAALGALCGVGLVALMSMDCYTYDHTCWLYFSNDVLVQWGRPQDWKKEADHIQEIRVR